MTSILRIVPLALCLAAPAGLAQGDLPGTGAQSRDHVVIILDASGSMAQRLRSGAAEKMAAAKDALRKVLSTVPESTHIGLLVFGAANLRDPWAYPLGPRVDADLMEAIALPRPHSGTPLGQYMKIGADRLLEARADQYGYGTYRLLIVTDGKANDQRLVRRHAPEILSRGIVMDVIGVDMDQEHTLAGLAHSYRRADDPESLEQAIRETFAEVSGSADGMSMEEAFDLIAPIPPDMAGSLLQALSSSGNHPIGSRTAAQALPPADRAARTATSPQAPRGPAPAPPAPGEGSSRGSNFLKLLPILILIALVIAVRRRK